MEDLLSNKVHELISPYKIEEVIRRYIDLTKQGSNFFGRCPFEIGGKSTFVVSPSKQLYKCFRCGRSGNALSFIMDYEKCNFDDAIISLQNYKKGKMPAMEKKEIEQSTTNSNDNIARSFLDPIKINFNSNVKSIKEFLAFDKYLLEYCISQIEDLDEKIRNNKEIKITNVNFYPGNTLTQLRNIRQHDSFKLKYNVLNNQSVVLLISYFTSSLKEIFKGSLEYIALHKKDVLPNIDSDLKLSFQELSSYNFNLANSIGDIVIRKKEISFQDMQSTLREFKTYFDLDIAKTFEVDNIILAQAARHAIVHSLSIADQKFINQISKTSLRSLKTKIILNDEIEFSQDEVSIIINDLTYFINHLATLIENKYK